MLLIGLEHQIFPVGLKFVLVFVCLFYFFSPFPQACLDFFYFFFRFIPPTVQILIAVWNSVAFFYSFFKDEWITDAFLFLDTHCLCLLPLSQCVKYCPVECVAPRQQILIVNKITWVSLLARSPATSNLFILMSFK